ncbi:LAFE_0G04544g1_1 [Lachancea fermentati]|uniref:LAFE_0G04544g1_1 n=1 Tax=Lachancea fermentati TaxID=4955 RepID=A0A1G4MH03_LACFM|nr:LAFE_0G04544g1_1 [Lachancea fermentati]
MKDQSHKHWLLFKHFISLHKYDLFKTYVLVPIGVILTLCVLYGVDRLIRNVIKVTFPASVAVMLINFALMCCLSAWRRKYAELYVKVIDVPLSWSLRWMNLFFTPAFVTLPLSAWISLREAMLIVAVFVIGYWVTFIILAYVTILGQKVLGSRKLTSFFVRQEELENGMEEGSSFAPRSHSRQSSISERRSSSDSDRSITTYHGCSQELLSSQDEDDFTPLVNIASNSGFETPKSGARGSPEPPHDDNLQISASSAVPVSPVDNGLLAKSGRKRRDSLLSLRTVHRLSQAVTLQPPEPSLFSDKASVEIISPNDTNSNPVVCQRAMTRQFSHQVDLLFSINTWQNHLHHILYGLGFFATIFTYYFTWYVSPFQFFTAVVTFMFIIDAPILPNPKYKKFMHPVICSVALTWLIMLISVMIKHREVVYFLRELKDYKTGRTYLHLFDNNLYGYHEWPGAGDIFTSCMDVSIVGLSMPMYSYRHDLRRHFLSMIPPILLLCAGSLFLYPLICYHIGISQSMSIGFAGRSITLALGTPTIENLEGSVTIMAVTTVISGIVGVLTGGPMLDLIRVPENDYVTRGLTLGCNCGAIATAYLLSVDRRAAAISTLSFVLFGTFMVVLSAVVKVKDFVQSLVGM